jgi:hypothetical protein
VRVMNGIFFVGLRCTSAIESEHAFSFGSEEPGLLLLADE